MNPMPKYAILSTVNGKHFGRYKLVGVRYSETVGEHIYTAIPVDAHGNAVSVEVNVVESCLAD